MNRDVCDRCGKVTRPDDVHTCTPKALRMNLLLESAQRALAAIENGESFQHLDNVIAPMLKKGIDSEADLVEEVRMLQEQNTELDKKLAELSERKLTDEVIADLWYKNGTHHHHFARAVERWLKGE
jgi:hypothetical protein